MMADTQQHLGSLHSKNSSTVANVSLYSSEDPMSTASLAIDFSIHIPRSLVSQTRIMVRLVNNLKVTDILLLICVLLAHWRVVSSRDSFDGGRKALELTSYVTNDGERMPGTPSSVCRILHQEGNKEYCFGALVNSRWLLTPSSCAPNDIEPSNRRVRVICGTPSSSPARIQNKFNVVEVRPLRNATAGKTQEPDISLLKLDTDAPGPFVKFEESDGPEFFILEQKKLMKDFFNVSDCRKKQKQDSWKTSNIDLVGLPLLVNSSAMRNIDGSENSFNQTKTSYVVASCRLYDDKVKRCTFSRITSEAQRSICIATRSCHDVPSTSTMTPALRRSLSSSQAEVACPDLSHLYLIEERRPILPFVDPPRCSNETMARPQNMMKTRQYLQALMEKDDAPVINEWLVCSNFDINSSDSHQHTLLHDAALQNAKRTAQVLCDLHIDIEARNAHQKTALIVAAEHCSADTLEVIVNYNADVDAVDGLNKTALYYAALRNSSRMAQVLCDAGIDTEVKNAKGKTALIVAAEHRSLKALKVIVNCGANVNARDKLSKTALYYAAEYNSHRMAQVLCNAHINTEAKNAHGKTALIVAAEHRSFKALKVIINCKANVNAQDHGKRTALHYAALNCDTKTAKFLVKHHADCSIVDSGGQVPEDLIPAPSGTCGDDTIGQLHTILSFGIQQADEEAA